MCFLQGLHWKAFMLALWCWLHEWVRLESALAQAGILLRLGIAELAPIHDSDFCASICHFATCYSRASCYCSASCMLRA